MSSSDKIVLIVDDDPTIRDCVRSLLETELGVRALIAEDGRQGLLLAADTPPAFILTDVRMPNLDGAGLVRNLKASPCTRDIPIMVMAASRAGRDEAMAAGAEDYVDKPFDLDHLLAKVRRYLGEPAA